MTRGYNLTELELERGVIAKAIIIYTTILHRSGITLHTYMHACMYVCMYVHAMPGNEVIKIWQSWDICVHSFHVKECSFFRCMPSLSTYIWLRVYSFAIPNPSSFNYQHFAAMQVFSLLRSREMYIPRTSVNYRMKTF